MEALILKLSQKLKQQQCKLVTAESCTGGGLAYQLTSLAGSSDWFERGFVTYSNQAKQDMLGVQAQTLANFGAVSEQTAMEMAQGALKSSQANLSIAITGIAGPSGGTKEKPVGTVWLACANAQIVVSKLFLFSGDRQAIRLASIKAALETLLSHCERS